MSRRFPISKPLALVLALGAFAAVSPARAADPASAPAPTPASAAPAAPEPVKDPAAELGSSRGLEDDLSQDSFGASLVQLVVVLGIVLALVYLTLNFGLRRLMGLKHVGAGRSELITVIERIPLEQRVSLYVVKAGSDYLLLGRTDQGLSMLHELAPEEVERLQKAKAVPQLNPFLQKLLSRRGGSPPSA